MKAKKATQQKMHRKNSWGDGKQHLEELFKFTFFHTSSSSKKGLGESGLEQ